MCSTTTWIRFVIAFESIPRSHVEAAQVSKWKLVIDSKVEALVSQWTWTVILCPKNGNIVRCKWVFTVKYHPNITIARHKTRLVTRGFTHTYDIDYTKTFFPVIRLNFVYVLFSLVVNQAWSLLIDIMWPISQSHFHVSFLCSLNYIYSLSFLCDVCNEVH